MKTKSLIVGLISAVVFLIVQLLPSFSGNAASKTVSQEQLSKTRVLAAYDLGDLLCGSETTHQIKLAGQIGENVQISKVKSSCGCTSAVIDNYTINEGTTPSISATVTAPRIAGKFGVDLLLLDRDQTQAGTVRLRGNALPTLMSYPSKLGVDIVAGEGEGRIRVLHPGEPELRLSENHPQVEASLARSTIFAHESSLIDIRVRADVGGQTTISVASGNKTLEVPVIWRIRPQFTFHPNPLRITQSECRASDTVTRDVYVLYQDKAQNPHELQLDTTEGCESNDLTILRDRVGILRLTVKSDWIRAGNRVPLITASYGGQSVLLSCESNREAD